MARSDTLLNGSIMAMIAMALVFDDDENGPESPPPTGAEGLEPDEGEVNPPDVP